MMGSHLGVRPRTARPRGADSMARWLAPLPLLSQSPRHRRNRAGSCRPPGWRCCWAAWAHPVTAARLGEEAGQDIWRQAGLPLQQLPPPPLGPPARLTCLRDGRLYLRLALRHDALHRQRAVVVVQRARQQVPVFVRGGFSGAGAGDLCFGNRRQRRAGTPRPSARVPQGRPSSTPRSSPQEPGVPLNVLHGIPLRDAGGRGIPAW